MTPRGAGAPPTRPLPTARAARPAGALSIIALQRSAGNASTLALMRRARTVVDESPVTFTVPGVVDRASASSWGFDDVRGKPTGLNITRPTDANSPRLAKANTDGAAGVTATLLVRKLTPLGWIRELTLTMEDCMVSSYVAGDDYESVSLTFSRLRMEQ